MIIAFGWGQKAFNWKEKNMKSQTHHRHVRVLFAIAVFTFILTNQAWGTSYKAINLNPSGYYCSYVFGTNGTQQVGYGSAGHALLWNGSADIYIDLNPSGFSESFAYGISGTQQVGWGYGSATGNKGHALLWNGTADSYIDLHPSGFDESEAHGTNGTQQVGYGYSSATGGYRHALLWSGSADSFIDLNPSGFYLSFAQGISGTQQVGSGYGSVTGGNAHALLWSGSADSFIDLNPSGFVGSWAWGTSGTQQVGYGFTGDYGHALLWRNSADSYVDLNPSGFDYSYANGTNGTQQVGSGFGSATDNNYHALLWSGSATSYVDLHQFLPAEFVNYSSFAEAIDGYGNIVGSVWDNSGIVYAMLWQPITETDPIQEILDFIEKSVSDGTLIPVRPGPSGKGQLDALVNMIKAAGELLKNEDIKGACGQLHAALGKTDGKGQPPDFVKGEASVELAQMIQELMASLGCQ
jgi:hypothetical protein